MFAIDQQPESFSRSYPAAPLGLAHGVPFSTAIERVGLPQHEAPSGSVSALGQLPSSYPDRYRYQSVPAALPWGCPPTTFSRVYKYDTISSYQKQPFIYGTGNFNRLHFPEAKFGEFYHEPKPTQSYIGLIAMALLSAPEKKLVLSDIYKYILEKYPYFRNRGPGWRNSIRHNLSLNECFIKSSRSSNGKGHFWAVHPANVEDFTKGDFRRRRAQRKVRKYMSKKQHLTEAEHGKDSVKQSDDTTDVESSELEDGCIEFDDSDANCELEIDVISVPGSVVEAVETKPTKRRGAFDMDTILSSDFPCVWKNVSEKLHSETKRPSPCTENQLGEACETNLSS